MFRIVGAPVQFELPQGYREATGELRYAGTLMRSEMLPERPDGSVSERDVSRFIRSRYRLKLQPEDEDAEWENVLSFADTETVFQVLRRTEGLHSEEAYREWRLGGQRHVQERCDRTEASTSDGADAAKNGERVPAADGDGEPIHSKAADTPESSGVPDGGSTSDAKRESVPADLDLAEVTAELFGPELWRCSLWRSRQQASASGSYTRVSREQTFDMSDDLEVPDMAIRLAFQALAGNSHTCLLTRERLRDYMYRAGEKDLIPLVELLFDEVGSNECDLETFRHLLVADYFELASVHGGRSGADGFYVTDEDGAGPSTYFDDCDTAFEAFTGIELERDVPLSELEVMREVAESGGSVALGAGEETLLSSTGLQTTAAEDDDAANEEQAVGATRRPLRRASVRASRAVNATTMDVAGPANEEHAVASEDAEGMADADTATGAIATSAAPPASPSPSGPEPSTPQPSPPSTVAPTSPSSKALAWRSPTSASRGERMFHATSEYLRAQAKRMMSTGFSIARESQKVLDMVLDDGRSLGYTMLVFLFFYLTVITYAFVVIYLISVAWKCSSDLCVMVRVGYSWVTALLLSVILGLMILVPLNSINCRTSAPASAVSGAALTSVYTFVPFFVTWFLSRGGSGDSRFHGLRSVLSSKPFSALMIVTACLGFGCMLWQAYLGMVQSAFWRTRVPGFRSWGWWIRRPRFQRQSDQLLPWGRRKTLRLMREAIDFHDRMRQAEDLGDLSVFVEVKSPRESFIQFSIRRARFFWESNRLIWSDRILPEEGIVVPARIRIAQVVQVLLICAAYAGTIFLATLLVHKHWVVPGLNIVPTPWNVYASFSFGGTIALLVALAEAFMIPGTYRKIHQRYRSGRWPLDDRAFAVNKNKLHRVSFVIGISAWCSLWGYLFTAILLGGALFLLTWSRSRVIAIGLALTWTANGIISVTKNTIGYSMLNRLVAVQLYRRRVFAFILTDIGETAWIIASGFFWLIGRIVIYLLIFAVYLGRVDTNPWNAKLSVLDGFSGAFATVALAFDAHHHPFVNRLCTLLLLRAAARRQRDARRQQRQQSGRLPPGKASQSAPLACVVAERLAVSGLHADGGDGAAAVSGANAGATMPPVNTVGTYTRPVLAPVWRLLLVLALMPDMIWRRAQNRVYNAVERRAAAATAAAAPERQSRRHLTVVTSAGDPIDIPL